MMTERYVQVPKPQPGMNLVATLDQGELVLRFTEALAKRKRPAGAPNDALLDELQEMDPHMAAFLGRLAMIAFDYVSECMTKAEPEATQ